MLIQLPKRNKKKKVLVLVGRVLGRTRCMPVTTVSINLPSDDYIMVSSFATNAITMMPTGGETRLATTTTGQWW